MERSLATAATLVLQSTSVRFDQSLGDQNGNIADFRPTQESSSETDSRASPTTSVDRLPIRPGHRFHVERARTMICSWLAIAVHHAEGDSDNETLRRMFHVEPIRDKPIQNKLH